MWETWGRLDDDANAPAVEDTEIAIINYTKPNIDTRATLGKEMKQCGHACYPSNNPGCCACMDARPHLVGNTYPSYVDGQGWVDKGCRDDGYCPVCKLLYDYIKPKMNNNIDYDQNIDDAENIWYMNGLGGSTPIHKYDWTYHRENGYVITWNQNNKNKLDIRLKIGDIIAWYLQGNGYVGILRVCDNVEKLSDEDKLKQKINNLPDAEYLKQDKLNEEKLNYYTWKIPVEFLAYTDKTKCITKCDINYNDEHWSSGFRGSFCIKPKNIHWNNQIIDMYKKMKFII